MKELVERMESQPELVVMRHFFWRRGAELQTNACGFFRSLMCQFLPCSYRSFGVATSKYEKMSDESLWEPQWMKDFLEKEIPLSCKNDRNLRFVILIDALDECNLGSRYYVMDFLTNLLSAQEGPPICVSYALLPGLFPESLEIDITSKNGPDIASFVENKLSTLPVPAQVLKTDIVRRAKGMFMWARRACEKVVELQPEGKPISAIRQAIESLPEELNDVYLETIREINPANVNETLMFFKWVCFARWPLTVSELQDAIMMTPNMKETSIESMRKSDSFRDRDEMIMAIHHLSLGFAELIELPQCVSYPRTRMTMCFDSTDRTIVQLIHDSVLEFLLYGGLKEISKQDTRRTCSEDETEDIRSSSHFHLSRSCIRYFSMEERHMWTRRGVEDSYNISSFPLLEYAVTSWIFHTKKVELARKSQGDVLKLLRWPSPHIFNDWRKVRDGSQESDEILDSTDWLHITLLHVLARYGIVSVLNVILNDNEIEGGQKVVEHRRRHTQGVNKSQEGLIISTTEAKRVNLEVADMFERTPLWYAARANEVPAAQVLLKFGAKPNGNNSFPETPFYQAARYAGEEMMKAFLELPVESVRITEEVLMAAAGNTRNGPRVMRVLLDMRLPEIKITSRVVEEADINYVCGEEVMRVLIEAKKLEIDAFEGVLEYILKNFKVGTAKLFLRLRCPGIVISEDMLVAAAGNYVSGVAITKYLFASQPTTIVTERMMESAARNRPQGSEVMKIFLQKPSIKTITTRTLLLATQSWAKGEESMMMLLRHPRTGEIPEHVMRVAARNEFGGGGMIKAFLTARRSAFLQQVKREGIPDELLLRTINSWENGVEVIQLLLKESWSALDTKKLAKFTTRSKKGANMMQFLLEEPRFGIRVTTEMIKQATMNGASERLIDILVQKRVADIPALTSSE